MPKPTKTGTSGMKGSKHSGNSGSMGQTTGGNMDKAKIKVKDMTGGQSKA